MRKTDNSDLVYMVLPILLVCFFSLRAVASPPVNYPVPPDSDVRLFYLQRSTNPNTVVYDANLLTKSQLNAEQPVEIYWLRYNTNGERRELSFTESKFAYGLNFDPIDNTNAYLITLLAYSGRDITVFIDKDGKPVAQTIINGKPSKLKRIYIDVDGSGFWSSVNYIELSGNNLSSGKPIVERFNPNVESDWF